MTSMGPGSRVAGYRLEEQIGQGGMAVVFRARDEQLDRTVALKILAPMLADNQEFQQRFSSESRAAAAIDDPHIVPVFAAGEADGMLFIAMRYVAGGDAQSMLKREGPLSPDRVAAIVSPVASALDAAHGAGLVHRDVKPSNMLMDVLPGRPAHVYLADFGLSKAVAATSGLTMAGSILGTLAYMSPEQLRSEPVDGKADQYSLACSAFELLAQAPPFQRDDPSAVMYAHLFEAPPQLTSRRPDLRSPVDAVLSRAMAKVPGERYASCGQFADALRGALGLAPYRSGLGAAPTHPPAEAGAYTPTEAAWPETRGEVDRGGPASGDVALPPPDPVTQDAAWQSGRIADEAAAPQVAPEPGASRLTVSGGRTRLRRRRSIAIAACFIAAAGVAAGLLLAQGHPAASIATVPISVKSAVAPVNGDVYVVYRATVQEHAQVSGKVAVTANGEVARLYAQQFPFRAAPVEAGSVTLRAAGGTAAYAFRVTPTLATRYRVELFPSSSSSAPIAMSGLKTIYVTIGEVLTNPQNCTSPVCDEISQVTFISPPSVLNTEISKTPYVYVGLNQSKTRQPSAPKWMSLGADHGAASAALQRAPNQFAVTATFSFAGRHDYFNVAWAVCLKDTFATDGLGLPGHHGCGDPQIPYPTGYLG